MSQSRRPRASYAVINKHLVPNTSSTIHHRSISHHPMSCYCHPSPFPNYRPISSALQKNQKAGSSNMSLLKLSWVLLVFASSNHQLRNNKNMVVDAFAHPIIIHQSSSTAIVSVQKQPQDHRALFQQHRPHQLPSKQQLIAWIQDTITIPPVMAFESLPTSDQPLPPTKEQIALLRQAFAAFYGTARDYALAEQLLTQAVDAWQKQPPDEQAGLYRVRGDCQMALLQPSKAIEDYTKALELLQRSKTTADPSELPAVYLGRARAIRSLHTNATPQQRQIAVTDYTEALKLSARDQQNGDTDDNNDEELLQDGARTNPYATWEYGMALRLNGQYSKAQQIHQLASQNFDDIGDPARAVISLLDAGIDAAAATSPTTSTTSQAAMDLLKQGIAMTKTVEGRDIPLLQRVIAKEGEGRMALASLAWTSGDRPEAENQLGLACQRLDQLEADAIARNKLNPPPKLPERPLFNIDDGVGAMDISCTRLRNTEYLTQRLEWPTSLQEKVGKLYSLSK